MITLEKCTVIRNPYGEIIGCHVLVRMTPEEFKQRWPEHYDQWFPPQPFPHTPNGEKA